MKRAWYFWPTLIAFLLIVAFLGWAFSLHGTVGLFRVNGTYRTYFLGAGLAALLAAALGWLATGRPLATRKLFRRTLATVSVIVAIPLLFAGPAAFITLSGVTSPGVGDTPPQLLLVERQGAQGVPDLAVTFNTREASRHTLTWGQGAGAGTTLSEAGPLKQHAFVLADLTPSAPCWYRVDDGTTYHFTAPPAAGALRFAMGSDAHYGSAVQATDHTRQMLAQVADPAHAFNLFFLDGDIVDRGYAAGQWQEAFTALSATTAVIPTRLIPGNHDTLFAGTRYVKALTYPAGLPLTGGTALWQRYDAGRVHFLSIDLEWSAEAFTAAQAAWLEAQLKSIPAGDWKIVLGHGYYYASGARIDGWDWWDNPETIGKLTPLFEKYGVDLVFSGHAHQMELLQQDGVTYAICGGFGGASDENPTYHSPASVWYSSGRDGFLDVTVAGDAATLVFRAPDWSEIHRMTVAK